MKFKFYKFDNKPGVAAFLLIIIIGAATLIMASSAAWVGLGEMEVGFESQSGSGIFYRADGCLEDALRRLQIDNNYSGGTLNFADGSCIIDVTGILPNKTIIITANQGVYNKKIQSNLTISSGVLEIVSWQELEN